MKIAGIQKLTLLDFPGRCAATIFMPGCNLRCPFCHNAYLVLNPNEDPYDQDKILEFLKERLGKLTGLAVTGGEPLQYADIADFLRKVKSIGYAIKLDTNGCFPDSLKALIDEGLVDYVAMDIKNSWASYPKTIGLNEEQGALAVSNIQRSMDILKNSNIEFEFRSTIVNPLHSKEDIEEMAKAVGPVPHYFLQCFADSGDILGDDCKGGSQNLRYSAYEKEVLYEFLEIAKQYSPNVQLRGVD